MMIETEACPHCKANLQGDPIPQEYLDKGYYAKGATHYSRVMGIEIQREYDGILFWTCPDCGMAWNRWDFDGAPERLRVIAESYVVENNEMVTSACEGRNE